jgi:hypothetical protein
MLGEQVAGRSWSKKDLIRRLQFTALAERNESSINRKLSNISAILKEVSAPLIRGYKPLPHYQKALRVKVLTIALSRGIYVEGT